MNGKTARSATRDGAGVAARAIVSLGLVAMLLASGAFAQTSETASRPSASTAVVPASGETRAEKRSVAAPAVVTAANEAPSEAERISRLRRSIEEDRARLDALERELQNPESEYRKAEAEFQTLDTQRAELNKQLEKLRESDRQTEAAQLLEKIQALDKPWKLAKDRFQLAIEERKTLQQKITILEQKLVDDQKALDTLTGDAARRSATKPRSATPPSTETPKPPAAESSPPRLLPSPTGGMPLPGLGALGGAQAAEASVDGSATAGEPTPEAEISGDESPALPLRPAPAADRPELATAREQAHLKLDEAQAAAQAVEAINTRIESLKRNLELERQLRATARKKSDNASETERALALEVQRRLVEGAPQAEIDELWKKINEATLRYREAVAETRERSDTIDALSQQLASAQAEKILAVSIAEQKQLEAEQAQAQVERLENPLALPNIVRWLIDHGPPIALILLGMFLLNWIATVFGRRILYLLTYGKWSHHGKHGDRQDRAATLASVTQNAASVAILVGGVLMILEELGIDVKVLMGGVAVLGLAVAFGAQNLIKDYFTGFMILLENQYALNDVVKIGDIAGQVEQVTMRLTVLRDLEGKVHFIPNGQIQTVTNMTHGWSRALFEIRVAYKEDVDQVMDVLVTLGKELRADSYFGPMILEDPTMLGVDAISESAIMIKFYIKTRPLKQWEVRRELLRRIKNRFNELQIEMPFPHRTVYHRFTDADAPLVVPRIDEHFAESA